MLATAKQLASITAAGASALVLTSGKAEAASIIVSDILNVRLGFGNSPPSGSSFNTAGSLVFNTFVGGPDFRAFARSNSTYTGRTFFREVYFQQRAPEEFIDTTLFSNNPVAAGVSWVAGHGEDTLAVIGQRTWGAASNVRAGSYTDEYFLFKFRKNNLTPYEYGWIETSLSVTEANSSAGSDGPTVTIVQYAYNDTGAVIAAGDTGAAPSPEPSSLAEIGLAALILGAEGLRRWRKLGPKPKEQA